jgi:transcriptional regulator with XRE-family HTH domain
MLDLITIGKRLKEIRGSITQNEIAEEFGVKRSYIGNIETGRTQPSLEYLLFNSTKFNISLDWIVQGEEVFLNEARIQRIFDILIKNKQEWVLIEALAALSKNEKVESAFKSDMAEQQDDPQLSEMIKYLISTWYYGDEKVKNWLEIQFQKCFPDYREELQKNRKDF